MKDSSQNTGWKITLGILLMLLGLITLGAQAFTTYVTVLFLGWMLIIGGVAEFVYGFFSGSIGRAVLYFLAGVLSFVFGVALTANPAISAASLTLLIGIFMVVVGIYRTFAPIIGRYSNWGWSMAGGILVLLLGLMILGRWPVSGLYIIGLFIGIELFINGFGLMLNASAAREEEQAVRQQQSAYLSGAKGGKAKRTEDNEDIN